MNRPIVCCLLFVLAVGLGFWTAGVQAETKGKWEYKVLELRTDKFLNKADWKSIRKKYETDRDAIPHFKQYVLNTLDQEGWQLVDVEPGNAGQLLCTYYFRKPRR